MLNIFDSKDNTTKIKRVGQSPAINQGKKFKKYQNKITNSLEKNAEFVSGKEGFTGLDGNGLTAQTNRVINKNNYSNQQQSIDNLRQEYQNTLQEYENLAEKLSGNTTGYINRVSPDNPYLNKVISFTSGQVCYVTNQGVVKWIPSMEIWQSLSIPQTVQVQLNIPWQDSYSTPGTQIPTTPPLVSGTNVETGQSFGNEGSNVFVNQLLPKGTTASYMGCYATSPNNDNMTFIGGAPPSTDVSIQNGNFNQPVITANSYQYINNGSTVPGWIVGNAALLNNSTAWGYPMPYPNGNQCISIQNTSYIVQIITLNVGVNYTITFSACSRNCCNSTNVGNPVAIQLYTASTGAFISTVGKFTPNVNSWQNFSYTFTVPTTQSYKLFFWGTNSSGDQSTAVQNISLSGSTASSGSYTYNDCMQSAVQQGYQYFALQNVNTQTSTGYCAVSNSSPAISQYGNATVPNKMIALWSSNTSGQTGNTAILSNTGSLQVLSSSGQSVFSTPATNANPANYLGCYGDAPTRAMTSMLTNGSQQYNNSQCQQSAQQQGFQYYGLQNSSSGTTAQCFLSNNISQTMEYGAATNCTQISDGSWSGGGWSNAVYNTTLPQSNYFLILQDDGNMCIYRGTGPNDNQGFIWATQTNGQQQVANPNVAASEGKYGQNWMPSGGTLAPGDFVGSSNGNLALVMQSDGNLVLYTYQMETNCQKMADGNTGGGLLANAAYNIGKLAVPGNMGKLAYIDANAELHSYPSNNQTYANTYTVINNANTPSGNIDGATYSGATLESCQNSCNTNPDCAGFVFSGNTCYPKNNSMYPYGGTITSATGVDTYIRNVIPSSPPIGVTQNTANIDTIKYGSYDVGGAIGSKYGLANANSVEKQQLNQLQTKLNLLSNQITNLTGKFGTGSTLAENQGERNNSGIDEYLQNIKNTNKEIKTVAGTTTGGLQNILKDSDIIVLQKNYDYLFWSILAAGAVLVSMNIVKKQ